MINESPSKINPKLHFFNNAPRGDPANTSIEQELQIFDELLCDNSKPIGCDTSFEQELKQLSNEILFETCIMNQINPTQLPPPNDSPKKLLDNPTQKTKTTYKNNKQN